MNTDPHTYKQKAIIVNIIGGRILVSFPRIKPDQK